MRLTRKRKQKNVFFEFIVMMVFCFMVGYSMRGLWEKYPIILWTGIGIFGAYTILLLIAMIILIKQKKEELAYQLAELEQYDDFEYDIDETDWILDAFKIGERVFRKLYRSFILIGGIFFVCNTILTYFPKDTEMTLTKKELEEMILQNHGKLLEDNISLQQHLKAEYYENATKEEQIQILGNVLVTEASYLGIEPPAIRAEQLADNLGGYYQTKLHTIVINENNLSMEEKVLNTLFHELYHAYQYTCVKQLDITGDLLWAKQVAQWKEEFEKKEYNVNTNDGMIEYYTQDIEESARKYAEERLPVYLQYAK